MLLTQRGKAVVPSAIAQPSEAASTIAVLPERLLLGGKMAKQVQKQKAKDKKPPEPEPPINPVTGKPMRY